MSRRILLCLLTIFVFSFAALLGQSKPSHPGPSIWKEEFFQPAAAEDKNAPWSFPADCVQWVQEDGRSCLRLKGNGKPVEVLYKKPLPVPNLVSLEFKATGGGMLGLGASVGLTQNQSSVWTTDHRAAPNGWLRVTQGPKLQQGEWYRVEVENQLLWSYVRLFPAGKDESIAEILVWHDPQPKIKLSPISRAPVPASNERIIANLTVTPVPARKLSSTPPAAPKGLKTIFFDDFNGPNLVKWGSYLPGGGRLLVPAKTYWNQCTYVAEIPDLKLEDGVVQFRVRLLDKGAAMLQMRLNAYENGGYYLQLPTDKPVQFQLVKDNNKSPIGTTEKASLTVGQWHQVAVSLEKNALTAWLDGKKVAWAEDAEKTYQDGLLGIGTAEGGPSEFDDVAVFSRDGQYEYKPKLDAAGIPLWPGVPNAGETWSNASWLALPEVKDADAANTAEVSLDRQFTAAKPVRAFLNIAADGEVRAVLNGKELWPKAMSGNWYQGLVADITGVLANGQNSLQLFIHPSGPSPAAIAVLGYQDEGGEWHYITTDGQWKTAPSGAPVKVLGPYGMEDRPWVYDLRPANPKKVDVQVDKAALPDGPVALGEPFEVKLSLKSSGRVGFPPDLHVYFLPEGVEDTAKDRLPLSAEIVEGPAKWQESQALTLRVSWTTLTRNMFQPGSKVRLGLSWSGSGLVQNGGKLLGEISVAAAPPAKPFHPNDYTFKDGFLMYESRQYVPLAGSDGAYYVRYEPPRMTPASWAMLIDKEELDRLKKFGMNRKPVLCRLVDWVDVTKTDHNLDEDGGLGGRSRLIPIAGETFRVTSPRRIKPSYFVYDLSFANPTEPHLVVYRTPNDIARICTVNPIPSETGSGGVYTGVIFQLDGKAYNQMFVYYPPSKTVRFCVMYSTAYAAAKHIPSAPQSGAAISGLWSLQLEEPIQNYAVLPDPSHPFQRTFGIDYTEPGTWVYRIYGIENPNTPQKRQACWASFIDYSRFSGANSAHIDFIGSDWIGTVVGTGTGSQDGTLGANYDSEVLGPSKSGADFFKELVPLAEERKFIVVPTIAAFMLDGYYRKRLGITEEMYLIDEEGKVVKSFDTPRLNPFHPHVQEVFYKTLGELADRSADMKYNDTIAVRLNGFGLGLRPTAGYEPYTLKLFAKETGVAVPTDDAAKAVEYLKANAWDKWIDWRCQKIHQLWAGALDVIVSKRKDLKLQIMYMSQTTFNWVNLSADARREDMRKVGLDQAMFAGDKNIIFEEVWTWEARYAQDIKDWPWRTYPTAESGKNIARDLSVWSGYWEQPSTFSHLSQFKIGWLASASSWPIGRSFYETFAYGLTILNSLDINLQNWERGLAQQECNLRRFARTYLPLGLETPKPFEGGIAVHGGTLQAKDLVVRRVGDLLQVVNTAGTSGKVDLTGIAGQWVELGRGDRYDALKDISVLPFDSLTFAPAK